MITVNFFLALLLGLAAAVANTYFTTKYGADSPVLILSISLMSLAIVLAANGGEMQGRKQQQKDIAEAIDKSNSLLRTEMDNAYAKGRCSKCENNPLAGR